MKHSRKRNIRNTLASLMMAGLGLGFAGMASADLVYLNLEVPASGEGYGNVVNLLSMQLPSSGGAGTATDVEDGKVAWNGSADVITSTTGTVLTDPNKTATQTFATVGLSGTTAAAALRLIWDPSEVGSPTGDDTQVNTLILSIYDAAGNFVYSDSLTTPVFHDHVVNPGLGVGDFAYGLDTGGISALQAFLDGVGDFSQFRIGLESNVSFADDGPDTWLLAQGAVSSSSTSGGASGSSTSSSTSGGASGTVPEPNSSGLVFLGLGAVLASFLMRGRTSRKNGTTLAA